MRSSRGSVRLVLGFLACVAAAVPGRAQLLVAAPPGTESAVAHAELAYAEGAGAPVTWVSLRLRPGPAALVAALPASAQAETALDAWFTALETTASPNVLLPSAATDCGHKQSYVHVAWPRSTGAAATEVRLHLPEDVTAALDQQGLSLSGALPVADQYLVWSWPDSAEERSTPTLRVLGGAAPLAFLPGSTFPVLVSAVTRGASTYPGEVDSSSLDVTFVAGKPSSNYVDRLRQFLDAGQDTLLEMRARGPLFDWSIYDDSVSLAPLVRTYAAQALREVPDLDVEACSSQLRALRNPDAPAASACGTALDASLALSAVGSELATLQRFAISAATGLDPSRTTPGGEPSSPVLRAKRLDASACPTDSLPTPSVGPPSSAPNQGAAPGGTTTVVIEETVVVDDRAPVEPACGGSTQPTYEDHQENTSCSGDTSGSSDTTSSDSSCSGDSSSSSESGDSSCSGDSSSSSSSNDDGGCSCGSPGSSSSSSDDQDAGCSSGSSEGSGYNGDTCSASAAPGAARSGKARAGLATERRARAARPRRLKTSLWSLAFVAVILPIRRRKRVKYAGG